MERRPGVRLLLATFLICRTENLCEASLAKLDEIRKLNNTKSAIQILTNSNHQIRPYFMKPNKLNDYEMRPKNLQPLFIKTAEFLGEKTNRHHENRYGTKIRKTAMETSVWKTI
jgi:hypothetical protein